MGPLNGVKVVELAGIGPGPFAGMMLADMGAQVVRVDRIPSDSDSALADLMRNDSVVDRGRRSIAVNMKDSRGLETVLKLVDRADILIEGFRPGVTEKLGIGPAPCHARNRKH
jgi:alpha-methylacyl-CoA racemase